MGEALISVGGDRHVILDPFQDSGFRDAGWEVIRSAQLDGVAMLLRERSQIALPRLAAEGMSADAACVDGVDLAAWKDNLSCVVCKIRSALCEQHRRLRARQ